jgi:hypothetical protein
MQYALLIYGAEDDYAQLGEAEGKELYAAHERFGAMLAERGVMRGGMELASVSTATTVRREGDERVVLDGPFAETKEQLGGFYLVEAADLDEALEYAKQIPLVAGHKVEVRPEPAHQ